MISLEKIQEKLDSQGVLLLSNGFEFTNETLESFIQNLLETYNFKFRSKSVSGHFVDAYVGHYWRRSKGDIYRLCKGYFANTTLKEVLIALYGLYKEGIVKELFCTHISKRVWTSAERYKMTSSIYYTPYEHLDEDGMSMDDLKKLYEESINVPAQ